MNHLLPDTCTIQRYTVTGYALNNDEVKSWVTLSTVKCRISEGGGRENTQPNQAVVTNPKVFLPVTDVTEKDRLVINELTYQVLVINTIKGFSAAHHIEADVELVKE